MDDRDVSEYRKAYRHLLKGSAAPPPSDEELTALVTGELEGEERGRVALRMLQSPEAMEKHRILEELHQQVEGRRPAYRSWLQGAGVAATVLLAFAVWTLAPIRGSDPDGNNRSDAHLTSSPSGNISLKTAPTVFRWTAEPGARRYRVEIFDDAAESLWQSSWIAETTVPAPSGSELVLSGDARYFWIVEVDGVAARQTLGPYWFRLDSEYLHTTAQ